MLRSTLLLAVITKSQTEAFAIDVKRQKSCSWKKAYKADGLKKLLRQTTHFYKAGRRYIL